jgi:hypothetical protein
MLENYYTMVRVPAIALFPGIFHPNDLTKLRFYPLLDERAIRFSNSLRIEHLVQVFDCSAQIPVGGCCMQSTGLLAYIATDRCGSEGAGYWGGLNDRLQY